ncbi:MAG: tRNA lysidine(34) synthetase TilS [Tissierellaceae bacterium]|nr:tRNA lysidine(34) synthetase TilS [Tissierellaceae bacterium]
MEDKVLSNIIENNLILDNENIVVGVSGGPDSMALLYMLLYVKKHINFNLIIAHVNHGVRGDEALRDQLFVKRKANELGLPFYTTNVDMIAYGNEHKISAEEAGRELRYNFFRSIIKSCNGGKIALAHNMNDQAETLMMRIIRGTGIDGLNGMSFINGDIIRPILNITRSEIEKYIEDYDIETVLDKTNLMPIYTRNKIRLELLPYLEKNFNPNLITALWRLSQTSQDDSAFLQKYTEEKYLNILINENKNQVILDFNKFKELDLSIQKRIVIFSITKIVGVFQGFGEEHISSVVNLFSFGSTGKFVQLPNDIVARVDYNNLIIEKSNKNTVNPFVYDLFIGYNQFSDLGYSFKIKVLDIKEVNENDKFNNIKYFDYDRIVGSLYLRNRQDGDRFIPFGMKGSKKLKDFFIDLKVSRDERDRVPLIVDDENIIWVVGYRINELYKLTNNTKNVLMIEYISVT